MQSRGLRHVTILGHGCQSDIGQESLQELFFFQPFRHIVETLAHRADFILAGDRQDNVVVSSRNGINTDFHGLDR